MKIPQQVIEAAQYEGCNSVKYLEKNGTLDVFGICEVDDNGRPVPVGLPTLVLWDGDMVEFVCGEDALNYPIGENGIEIPQQVKKAAEGMGTVITYVHRLKGYDVYSVGTPRDENGDRPPTGLPMVVLFKDGNATSIDGYDAFKWLKND